MAVLVTGVAGFIGSHVARVLIDRGEEVIGIDNLNDYYDPQLKRDRLAWIGLDRFDFRQMDLSDRSGMEVLFKEPSLRQVVHLAAQAGVRYSLENPHAYADSNLIGFLNVLEGCRSARIEHLVYASSSSVYGANARMPFSEQDAVDHPLSLYAASKKANELMAHSYSHLYRLPCTGLRFFTVYGPWGRPDMALFRFTRAIMAGEPITVYHHGHHRRDFTYIDDVVTGIIKVLDQPAYADTAWDPMQPDPAKSSAPWRIYNIGNTQPVLLLDYIRCIEQATGKEAILDLQPMQPGDVPDTYADCSQLKQDFGYLPSTHVTEGVKRFVQWFLDYYRI